MSHRTVDLLITVVSVLALVAIPLGLVLHEIFLVAFGAASTFGTVRWLWWVANHGISAR